MRQTESRLARSPRITARVPAILVAIAAGLASLAIAQPAKAAAPAATAPDRTITLMGTDAVLGLTDVGPAGNSLGDIRTLSLTMRSLAGAPVGRAEVVQTLTRQAEGASTALKSAVITLPKGSVMVMGTTRFTDFLSPTARPDDATEQLAIVGGTGAYRGAGGIVDIAVLPDFGSRWTLSIDLPRR